MNQEEELHPDDVQQHLREVQELLARQKVVENLVHRQDMPRHALVETLVHKQHVAGLQHKLDSLHPADIAYILEALPLDQRLFVWDLVKAERDGEILLEVSDAVRESLIETMDSQELKAVAESLDADELADLAPDLPPEIVQDVFQSLEAEEREQLRAAMSYPEDSVGALMDFDMVTVREDVSLEVVLRYLRRFEELPDHTDQLFVVDRDDHLLGLLSLETLLINDPEHKVAEVMRKEGVISFTPEDEADDYAGRGDMIYATVLDVEMFRNAHSGLIFTSACHSRCGELFCYIKLDASDVPSNQRVEFRGAIEDALNPALLAAKVGGCIGGGSGLRYSYIDLALTDLNGAVPIIRQVLAEHRVPLRTWLLFFDDELSREWIGIYAGAPEPPMPADGFRGSRTPTTMYASSSARTSLLRGSSNGNSFSAVSAASTHTFSSDSMWASVMNVPLATSKRDVYRYSGVQPTRRPSRYRVPKRNSRRISRMGTARIRCGTVASTRWKSFLVRP